MKRFRSFILVLAAIAFSSASRADDRPIERIVFGSCAGQDRPQPFWGPVNALHPDLFVFLGDNVYADTVDPVALRHVYALLGEQSGYRQLRRTTTVMATWDDHDYGYNDAGEEHPRKAESQEVFLDFFGVPADSPRRRQKGVYNAAIYGPPGRRVQVILLDMRYFRSPLKKAKKWWQGYVPDDDPKKTFLGDEQWAWFHRQLRQPADLRFIGSSVQVVALDHPFEKWGNFPLQRERLFREIREAGARGVVILSGDRHHGELSVLPGAIGYDLYDITSSSFNKPEPPAPRRDGKPAPPEPNRYRVGPTVYDANFGVVNIDWHARALSLEIHNSSGAVKLSERVPFNRLRPDQ
jgi:alkaline phosphatase D